jgi:hypothetical protein
MPNTHIANTPHIQRSFDIDAAPPNLVAISGYEFVALACPLQCGVKMRNIRRVEPRWSCDREIARL